MSEFETQDARCGRCDLETAQCTYDEPERYSWDEGFFCDYRFTHRCASCGHEEAKTTEGRPDACPFCRRATPRVD